MSRHVIGRGLFTTTVGAMTGAIAYMGPRSEVLLGSAVIVAILTAVLQQTIP